MRNTTNKFTKCECCGVLKDELDVSICLSILKKTDLIKEFKLDYDLYDFLIDSNFVWACDECINNKKALLANPSQQNHTYFFYLAYYDSNLNCTKCNKEFTFAKEEKKFWYENLKFRKESSPVNCVICRKEIRKKKLQNNTLLEILKKNTKEMTMEELCMVAQIYNEWEIIDKYNFFNNLIKTRQNRIV